MRGLSRVAVAVACLSMSASTLAWADDPPDPVADKKAKAEAEKAAWDAEKAKSEAQAAAQKAKFGPLADWTSTGKVETGAGAGKLEASLLAAEVTRHNAQLLVARLCVALPAGGSPKNCPDSAPAAPAAPAPTLIIVAEGSTLERDAYDAFLAETASIRRQFDEAAKAKPKPVAPGVITESTSLVGVATVLGIASNLFRTEYSISGIDVASDDLIFAKEVALAAQQRHLLNPILIPGLYGRPALTPDNPAMQAIAALDLLRETAVASMENNQAVVADLQARAKKTKKKNEAARLQAEANGYAPVQAKLDAAIKRYDGFLSRIMTADDKGAVPFSHIARQGQLADVLDNKGYLLIVKANLSGGSAYTERNFWTFFGEMPFSISGGAMNSYALFEGSSGRFVDGGALSGAGPFEKVQKTNRRFLAK